jgi:hypothetical protein
MEVRQPKTIAQVTAQVRESRRQYRQQMLRSMINEVLPKGDYATFYRDIADCYKRCGLSIPKAFTLFVPDEEMVTKLREVITDKRIFITYSEKLEKGQIKLVPRVR